MVTTSFQNSSTTSHIVSSCNWNRSISFAAASLAFMLASNTFAVITQPQRITNTTLTGTNGTFSNAHYGYQNLLSVQASTIGDVQQSDSFSYKSNFQNVSASVIAGDATLNFAAPAYVAADGLYESPYTLTFGGSNLHSTWRFERRRRCVWSDSWR